MARSNEGSGIASNGVELSIKEAIQVLFQHMGGETGIATDGVDLSHSESIQFLFKELAALKENVAVASKLIGEWMEASAVVVQMQHEKIVELSHQLGEEPPPRMKWGRQTLN